MRQGQGNRKRRFSVKIVRQKAFLTGKLVRDGQATRFLKTPRQALAPVMYPLRNEFCCLECAHVIPVGVKRHFQRNPVLRYWLPAFEIKDHIRRTF
jgi:hypothetical protein